VPRKPHVEVVERGAQNSAQLDPRYARRLKDPYGTPSAAIQLKDKNLEPRWFNGAVGTDHIWRAKQNGWDQVRLDQIVDKDQLGGFTVTGGFVTRGERGQEVLMCMPRDIRAAIQTAKTKQNNANLGNPHKQKAEIVEAAAAAIGAEAAEQMDADLEVGHSAPIGSVRDSYERIERRDE
jgi:hypothetical protein